MLKGEFMKKVTKEMLKIYKPISNLDWMNYKIIKKDMTAHHILKKEDGGKMEQYNIALLPNACFTPIFALNRV